MRRLLSIVLPGLIIGALSAQPMNIECVGAKQIVNGTDTLFFFKDAINVHSKLGPVDWYNITTGMTERGIEDQYNLDEGGYYIIKEGVAYSPFYVFKYADPDINAISVSTSCEGSSLNVEGDLKPYSYLRDDHTTGTYVRTYSLSYNALAWNSESWADSAVVDSGRLSHLISMPPLYGPTPITLCYDAAIRSKLGLDSACLETMLPEEGVKAVKMELVALATPRPNDPAGNNELDRPTDQHLDPSAKYSGEVEVAFYSNPTPAARFFRWTIYKSSDVIATRNDQDIRYTFSAPGTYRVVGKVNNSLCASDSSETVITLSESYLRVPNVFTPNGDGKNDEFRVAYRSIREFHCWVYNRWGKLVFEWTDPAKGWDGTINGKPAAEGAYYYVIRALGTDAAKDASYSSKISYNKKKQKSDDSLTGIYQLSGDINLLRGKR